ncbi:hypothetical protein M5689_012775 [Euphorbia peplus]|nr:hypothetical protein M5689_012775 [Euphorbia peplus]
MNAQMQKDVVTSNEQGEMEKRIETVDYRSSAGQGQELRTVEVIHQCHAPKKTPNTSGGVLASAAESVASSLQSARDIITRKQ